jgi:FtsP/CotA-like multicopper oxidase with cupredoxin domain
VPVRSGERLRLRLCATSNARIFQLRFENMTPQLIAVDGQPIKPETLNNGFIELAPGQRADVIVDMDKDPGSEAAITEISRIRATLVSFKYHARERQRAKLLTDPIVLPPNPVARLTATPDKTVDLVMTGGAMGRMQSARYRGKELGMRELVREHKLVWAFNGEAGMPEEPLFSVKRGTPVAVKMQNDTAWPHAMHFHGHHFQVLKTNRGTPEPYLRDTVLMSRGEEATIGFIADNPGKWMIHCHMLEHQAGGMVTWFVVE